MYRHSTIDTKSVTCDVPGIWQTEKGDASCDFISGTKASQWSHIEHEFTLLFCDTGSKFCWHEAWCDRLGSNIAAGHFASGTQSQGDDSCFVCAVVSLSSRSQ